MPEQPIDFEQIEALGISREAYDEVLDIVGRIPTMEELSTLLAMWESNGRQQSLYGWLRGQKHTVERDEYLYTGSADHRSIREPRVKDCLAIALQLTHSVGTGRALSAEECTSHSGQGTPGPYTTGMLLYLVGNVSTEFADSEYARRRIIIALMIPTETKFIMDIILQKETVDVNGLNTNTTLTAD